MSDDEPVGDHAECCVALIVLSSFPFDFMLLRSHPSPSVFDLHNDFVFWSWFGFHLSCPTPLSEWSGLFTVLFCVMLFLFGPSGVLEVCYQSGCCKAPRYDAVRVGSFRKRAERSTATTTTQSIPITPLRPITAATMFYTNTMRSSPIP
eukprot:6474290-Amphidinium_carterae.1